MNDRTADSTDPAHCSPGASTTAARDSLPEKRLEARIIDGLFMPQFDRNTTCFDINLGATHACMCVYRFISGPREIALESAGN